MRKSFMNIKHFVDSNVRHRNDKTATSRGDPINDDLVPVERQFEDLRQLCVNAEKRISTMLPSIGSSTLGAYTQNVQASLSNLTQLTVTSPVQASLNQGDQQNFIRNYPDSSGFSTARASSINTQLQVDGNQSAATDGAEFDISKHHKKLPIVGFLKFLVKSCHKLRQDSLLATTLTHCSHLQTQLTKLYMSYERTIEAQCLKPIQQVLETDVPNVIRLRKLFIKAHSDLESVRARYNGANQKQLQQQQLTAHSTSASYTITQNSSLQANINKLDLLKKELDDAETRFEQAKDTYAIELYSFVCRETEFVVLFMKFYQHQAEYQAQVSSLIQNSLPSLSNTLATTRRRIVFGTPLDEHLRCTNRSVSVLVELCVHLLYSNALNEEGLFRIPGSSIKIKKLKSAINAWFVTLATNNELSDNQDYEISQRQLQGKTTAATHQPTILAIYSLFKDIVGQRPPNQHATLTVGEAANHNNQIISTTITRDEFTQANANSSTSDSGKFLFDVHAVAGLLKLYLRELPEPLLGDALYDQWVDACAKGSGTGSPEQIGGLKRVVEQLPKANYDNLRLLIRFLHSLTCHHEKNKMTATNLAITMAPSLIWTPKNYQFQLDAGTCSADNSQQMDEVQALTMQMSSMGISASLHALIVEKLINHAEQLFPGDIDFTLSNMDVEPASLLSYGGRVKLPKDRPVKSTSPTGSSTESNSSFSSTSNMSSSKKSGSTDGLAAASDKPSPLPVRPARPLSVHINQLEPDKRYNKPPIPPAPAVRSHTRQLSDSITSISRFAHRKPPAPPIPASCIKTQESNQKPETSVSSTQKHPVSLRGTGIASNTDNVSAAISRPSVPPPDRPHASVLNEDPNLSVKLAASPNGHVKDLKSPGGFRSEFEEISALEMIDDVDISDHISLVVSLDSASGDDSSFDNQSLDHSWTECDSDKDRHRRTDSSSEEATLATKPKESSPARSPTSSKESADTAAEIETSSEMKPISKNLARLAPSKPPRSSSPKTNAPSVTQSTLL